MELLFKYQKDKTEATCCGIADNTFAGDIVIPKTYNGIPIVAIGFQAFSKTAISSVHIPNTVTSIGMQAFAYCPNLKQVTFEEDSALEIIEPMAFSGCHNLSYIKLPDRLHVIEHLAFNNCTCEIPKRCLVMHPNFEGCKVTSYEPKLPPLAPIEQDEHGNQFRLNQNRDGYIVEKIRAVGTTINVPEMFNGLPVCELGDMAFSQNTEAWKAIIPASVKNTGYFPFYACDDLGLCEYKGSLDDWQNMRIYTWFPVYCNDGTIESQG